MQFFRIFCIPDTNLSKNPDKFYVSTPLLKKVHQANCLDMPSPLSYATLVSTALSCQRIKSSQAERSDTLCVPWLQIVPDWRSTNMMYMIVSCTGDVGRLRGGHQQDPL